MVKLNLNTWQDIADVVRELKEEIMKKSNIRWVQEDTLTYRATLPTMPRGFERGLIESDIDPVQTWCQEHNCGRRTSFDTFKFKKPAEVAMFLLRWGN